MEFDKSIGKGYWNVEDATLLDDLAFSLMCENIKKNKREYRNQAFFRNWKGSFPYNQYYEQAKVILRTEKIERITNGKR